MSTDFSQVQLVSPRFTFIHISPLHPPYLQRNNNENVSSFNNISISFTSRPKPRRRYIDFDFIRIHIVLALAGSNLIFFSFVWNATNSMFVLLFSFYIVLNLFIFGVFTIIPK